VSRLSRHCGILYISQSYRPPRPVMGIASTAHEGPVAGAMHVRTSCPPGAQGQCHDGVRRRPLKPSAVCTEGRKCPDDMLTDRLARKFHVTRNKSSEWERGSRVNQPRSSQGLAGGTNGEAACGHDRIHGPIPLATHATRNARHLFLHSRPQQTKHFCYLPPFYETDLLHGPSTYRRRKGNRPWRPTGL
jgi:hypothetical protein